MAVSDLIIQTLDPKITPPMLDVLDLETDGSKNKIRDPKITGYAQKLGKNAPFVKIGNARISPNNVLSMIVNQDSIIPTIQLGILDDTGTLTSVSYPRITPLITVYVASNHPKLKSFSQTFLITGVHSIPLDGYLVRYEFTGELYIPSLTGNFIKSYGKLTSAKALRKIAEELGLGFATNEDSTNDEMAWINPNLNYKAFIKQIADHAYKNETTFFDCFIDRYYVLNFINVEKQFNRDNEVDYGYPSIAQDAIDDRRSDSDKQEGNDLQIPIILTNSSYRQRDSDFQIIEYSMLGDNGRILKNSGFRKRIFLYRHGETDPVKNWYAEPLSTPDDGSGKIHQTPELEDFVNNDVVKWMGTDYGNSHSNYKFAKIVNSHNQEETEKNQLRIVVPGFNQNIIRGSRVRVNIFADTKKRINDNTAHGLENDNNQTVTELPAGSTATVEVLDKYLSDFYYVKHINYYYGGASMKYDNNFTTEFILSRRSWMPEPKLENIA